MMSQIMVMKIIANLVGDFSIVLDVTPVIFLSDSSWHSIMIIMVIIINTGMYF